MRVRRYVMVNIVREKIVRIMFTSPPPPQPQPVDTQLPGKNCKSISLRVFINIL